jgi:hypothetical protein
MTIRLSSELEQILQKHADEQHTTPEVLVVEALRERYSSSSHERSLPHRPPTDWNAMLQELATHCGVSLSDEAVSSEGLYD